MMRAMNERAAIRELVSQLGGPTHLSKVLGRKRTSITQWSFRGQIPWRWRAVLKILAEQSSIDLSDCQRQALEPEHGRQAS